MKKKKKKNNNNNNKLMERRIFKMSVEKKGEKIGREYNLHKKE